MKTRNVWILAALLCGQIGVQAQEALPKEVKVGKERIKARHEICLPQIDDYQLLKCDFHIHTIFSDGIVWPSLRVQEAWEEGLDAIAITDHIEGQPARRGLQTGTIVQGDTKGNLSVHTIIRLMLLVKRLSGEISF